MNDDDALLLQVRRIVNGIVFNTDDANDIAQHILLHSLAKERSSKYILRATYNEFHKLKRRRRCDPLSPEVIDKLRDPARTPLQSLEHREALVNLQRALQELPHRERQAVELMAIQELPAVEVASQTGVNVNTLRSRVKRGIARLRDILSRRS